VNVPTEELLVREVSGPLYQARFWMKFAGVMMIIYGGLTALTIIGIIFAWLPIWLGLLLYQAASSAELARSSGEVEALVQSVDKLRLYFTITGIVMLISVIIGVGVIMIGGLAMMAGVMELLQQASG
jgi:hypothetical protein